MGRPPRLLRWLIGLALLPAVPGVAQEQERERPVIYKWVDENGIAHYTADPERIPEALRDQLDARRAEREREAGDGTGAGASPQRGAAGDPGLWAIRDARPEIEARPEGGEEGFVAEPGAEDRVEFQRKAEQRALDERIASLREEILRDEERIKDWISDPEVDPVTLADDPEFREIAARLPRLQSQMLELEQQKRSGAGGEP